MKKSILAIFVALLMASALLLTSCSDSAVALATFADLMDTSYVAEYDKMASELVKLDGLEDYEYSNSNDSGVLLLFKGERNKNDKTTIMQAIYNVETGATVWEESYTAGKGTTYTVEFLTAGEADLFCVVKTEIEVDEDDDDYENDDNYENDEPMTEPEEWEYAYSRTSDKKTTSMLYGADGTLIVEKDGEVSLEAKSDDLYIFDDELLYDDNGTVKVLGTIPAYNDVDADEYDGKYLYSWGENGFVAYDAEMKPVCEWQIDQAIGAVQNIEFYSFGDGMVLAQALVMVADTESDYDAAYGSYKCRIYTYLINAADIEAKDGVKEIEANYLINEFSSAADMDGYVTDGAFVALAEVYMIEDKMVQTSDERVVALDAEAQIVFYAEIAANQDGMISNDGNGYFRMFTSAGTVILDEKGEQVATLTGSPSQATQKFLRFGNTIYDWTLKELVDLDDIDNAELKGVWDTYYVYTVTDKDSGDTTYYVGTANNGITEMFTKKSDDTKKYYNFYDSFYTMTKYSETKSTVTLYTVTGEKIQTFDKDEYQGSQSIGNGMYLIKAEDELYILK